MKYFNAGAGFVTDPVKRPKFEDTSMRLNEHACCIPSYANKLFSVLNGLFLDCVA
jgi:hypothetical protein